TAPWPYPSAFTTAHSCAPASASSSLCALRRIAARSTVSSERPIAAILAERARQQGGDVGGDQPAGRPVAGGAVAGDRRGGGREPGVDALREERADHPGEDVAGAGSRQRGVRQPA